MLSTEYGVVAPGAVGLIRQPHVIGTPGHATVGSDLKILRK